MFIRDPWTTTTVQQAGPVATLSGEPAVSDQVLLRQLHALAQSIYQAQQDIRAAQQRGDTSYAQARLVDLRRLRDLFQQKAAAFHSNDVELMGGIDRFILAAGTWIEQSMASLPGAIAAIPNAIVDGVGLIGRKVGEQGGSVLLGASVPVILVGGMLVWFLLQAERSRTVRRLVR